MSIIFVYITNPSRRHAERIAKALIEEKRIACANIFPVTSMYTWEGTIKNENEVVLLAKTTEEQYEQLVARVTELHEYDVPCITKLPAEPNPAYAAWLREEVS